MLAIEISKYRGTTNVIALNTNPPLAVDKNTAAKASFQLGENPDFLTCFFGVGSWYSSSKAMINAKP